MDIAYVQLLISFKNLFAHIPPRKSSPFLIHCFVISLFLHGRADLEMPVCPAISCWITSDMPWWSSVSGTAQDTCTSEQYCGLDTYL